MGNAPQASALRQVELLFRLGTATGLSDRELLEQFRDRQSASRELAFAALVERHGPMVQGVCRSILRDGHDADDAFQATFLILVDRARSLWVRDSLGPWLHQVAQRVASGARSKSARRRRLERTVARDVDSAVCEPVCDDLGPLLNQEIARLPERYRAPIVLCCLEGLTQQRAAGQLGWPLGTLQSRLARARARLQKQLVRRGLAPSIVLSSRLLPTANAPGSVAPEMVTRTMNAALEYSAAHLVGKVGAGALLSAFRNGVLESMLRHHLKRTVAGILAVVATAVSVGVWATQESNVRVVSAPPIAGADPRIAVATHEPRTPPRPAAAPADDAGSLKLGDGRADGKKSIGGSGEMVRFSASADSVKAAGVRFHGSRYGRPQPPDESFLIYFLSADLKRVLHTEMAPYSLLERGPEEWVDVRFDEPVTLPKTFWIALDFRATQAKGVYLSFDTSTGGANSRVGLPGMPASKVAFGGDWMIEIVLTK